MNQRYTHTAISLHWLMALGLIATFALGFYMVDLSLSPTKLRLFSWHKWAGVTLFVLLWVRLAWRLTHPAPPLPPDMPLFLQRVSHALHGLMYILMLVIPLSGWLMSSAKGFQTSWFGVLPLPDLLPKDATMGERLTFVHEALNVGLLGLVVVHTGAALKHRFIDRDGLLARMLPWQRKG